MRTGVFAQMFADTDGPQLWLTGMGIEMLTAGEVRATACPPSSPTAVRM